MVAHRNRTGELRLWPKRVEDSENLEDNQEDRELQAYPVLALGCHVIALGGQRLSDRIWVGGTRYGVEITRELHRFGLNSALHADSVYPALRACNGSQRVTTIARSLSLNPLNFLKLLKFLREERLLHLHEIPLAKLNKKDVGKARREVEALALPHGASMPRRTSFRIEIIGHDRTATMIASSLYGSGLCNIRLRTDNHGETLDQQIGDEDIGLGILNGSDIGFSKRDRFHEIANRSAIYPITKSDSEEGQSYSDKSIAAHLVISIGYPRSDFHQQLISEDRAFLIVAGFDQERISVGPFVLPGVTPCLRCFELNQKENRFCNEQVRQMQQLSPRNPSPIVATAMTSALAADAVIRWIDYPEERRNHPLLGRELVIDPLAPSANDAFGEYRRWHTHPECGCTWQHALIRSEVRPANRPSQP